MKIFCEDFKMRFEEYCDGDLSEDLRQACDAHLAECPRCHAFYYDHRQVDELMLMLPREAAPEHFTHTVMARWRNEQSHAAPSLIGRVKEFFRSPRLVILSEVAALVILVIGAYYFYNFHAPGSGAAASSDGAHAPGVAMSLPKPTTTPAAGTISERDREELSRIAQENPDIEKTIGEHGLIELAQSQDPATAAPDTAPETITAPDDALAASGNFDRYFTAVSEVPASLSLRRGTPDELNFWGKHDIRKGLRETLAADAQGTPHFVFNKIFRAADFQGLTGADVKAQITPLFTQNGGTILRALSQTELRGDTVFQFQGWVAQEFYPAFQSAIVRWQPSLAAMVASPDPLEPALSDDMLAIPALAPNSETAQPSESGASAVMVTVIFTFHM